MERRGGNHSEPLVAQTVLSARTAPQSGQTITGGSNSGKGRVFIYLLLDRDPEDETALKVGTLSTGREREVLKQK